MNILITGATGFIGRPLTHFLQAQGYHILPISRFISPYLEITPTTNWSSSLHNINTIIHLAARVHLMQDTAADPLNAYREANTANTLNLARQAAAADVRRFIFLSSIKVNGENRDVPYTEQDTPNPSDPYAISKWEAEQGLYEISTQTDMEVVILRPPLVYGAGVKANFLRLMQWVERGIPLPFGTASNQRSLLYLGNLLDAILSCIEHPAAAGKTFLICDNETLSTASLIRKIAEHFQRKPRLLNIPPQLLLPLLASIGHRPEAERLLGSLVLNNRLIRETLDWEPPFSVDTGLAYTINAYQNRLHA